MTSRLKKSFLRYVAVELFLVCGRNDFLSIDIFLHANKWFLSLWPVLRISQFCL